ncbi:MAG: hypothetical protein JO250_03910 [Armatimonadetes bacterium]|nr:hypothetical protein [Armatimonadota bacterium]
MLTLFALPKPFEGHIGIIQRNAIRSWTLLQPRPRIILFGDEAGTAEFAQEFGLCHVPRIARNEYGTPLVSDLFLSAQRMTADGSLCYVNADIILMSDFAAAADRVAAQRRRFLVAGRRWTVDLPELWDFGPGWEQRLRDRVSRQGVPDPPHCIDYFLFPAGFWRDVPPFAIGRFFWDNWLLYQARRQGAALVDASDMVMAVHQNHGYAHQMAGADHLHRGPEALRNMDLAGGRHHLYSLGLATHRLSVRGVRRRPPGRWQIELWQHRWNHDSREAYRALQRLSERSLLLRPFISPLLWAARQSGPARRRLGRALVAWREGNSRKRAA